MKNNMTFMKSKFFSLLGGGTVTMAVVALLSLSDVLIAGARLGEAAAAAVNLVAPVFSFASFAASIVTLGVPIIYTAAMGRFDREDADRAFGTGLTLAVLTGIILFAAVWLFGDTYLEFYGASSEVNKLAQPYFFWYKLIILQMPVSSLLLEMIIADGDETLATLSGTVQFFLNIGLSITLSAPLGIAGVGLASFIGNYVGLGIMILHFFNKSCSLKLRFFLSPGLIAEVMRYSLIDSASYLFLSLFGVIMNKFVMSFFGERWLIVVSAILAIKNVEFLFDGVGEAITPLMGIYLNEESYGAVKSCYRLGRRIAIAEGMVAVALLCVFSRLMVAMLGVSDPEVAITAVYGIRIMALGYIGVSMGYLITSYYLVVNRIRLGFIISLIGNLLMPVILSVTLGVLFGIYGIFVGICLSPYISLVVSAIIVIRIHGQRNFPLILSYMEEQTESHWYELTVIPDDILRLRDDVADLLEDHGRDKGHINKVSLLIEDLFMLIYEKNPDRRIYGECTVIIEEGAERIIMKDSGILFDLSDEDGRVSSLRAFVVSNVVSNTKKSYLTTMSHNRNMFVL